MFLRVSDAYLVFIKLRVVPFAIRSKYEDALEKLVAEDIIEKVEYSQWVSQTVLIVKPNGDLRICADYRCHHFQTWNSNPRTSS